jgi:hypothetical protein
MLLKLVAIQFKSNQNHQAKVQVPLIQAILEVKFQNKMKKMS